MSSLMTWKRRGSRHIYPINIVALEPAVTVSAASPCFRAGQRRRGVTSLLTAPRPKLANVISKFNADKFS